MNVPWSGWRRLLFLFVVSVAVQEGEADELPVVTVEGQPLGANIRRVVQAFELLGGPLSENDVAALHGAIQERDHARLQMLLDKHVLLAVAINPESRIKVMRGPAPAQLQ